MNHIIVYEVRQEILGKQFYSGLFYTLDEAWNKIRQLWNDIFKVLPDRYVVDTDIIPTNDSLDYVNYTNGRAIVRHTQLSELHGSSINCIDLQIIPRILNQ